MPTNTPHQYFTHSHDIEGCLANGSIVRRSKYGLGQFTNGDFMGFIEAVPKGMVEVDRNLARCLIPECCR